MATSNTRAMKYRTPKTSASKASELKTSALKTATVITAAAGLMVLGVGSASAHVHVDPASTAAGGFSQLTFRVPNESAAAKTTKVTVTLPTATPFTSVSVKPMDGWTAKIAEAALPAPVTVEGAKITKAPATVTWTADAAHQLGQHEYQTFSISVGRLPEAGTTVALPAAQTYSDGTVVNWNQPETAGQPEPEHPVPSFVTTAAADEHSHAAPAAAAAPAAGSTTADTATADTAAAASTTPVAAAPDNTFGIVGLGAGLLGLAAGTAALVRTRKR
ncbi:YcnI family protein [Arthrobacter sp. AFG20]|uniref:YcnI family copper-binding membrane protein n=1 Tax=Arthrobacter sp. AFG20 TaxID=1688671 RepID=UPI000C9EA524|nr:YcnI family protein [Arthrobacter sp. AFG20]PNH82321.1 nuclear export factor GLE1 [Arthrobacter sp. AFG20]